MNEALAETQNAWIEAMRIIATESDEYWASLSKDDQLKAFCAIMRKLSKAELKDHRSYRGILYDVFGFGPESYMRAQDAGFLDLHNAIFSTVDDGK